MKLVADIEANGLLREATKVHCIVAHDLRDEMVYKFEPSQISEGLELLASADMLVGHNLMGFDIPLLEKLHNFKYRGKVRDTLCMSKMFLPERAQHRLESYGIQFGRHKPEHEDWSTYSPEMLHRCSEDVEINVMTYKYLVDRECKDWNWLRALQIEQDFSYDQALQELEGVDVDVDVAACTVEAIDAEMREIDQVLLERLPLQIVDGGPVNRPFKKDGTYSKMCTDYIEYLEDAKGCT